MSKKERLDTLLVQQGLAQSLDLAQRLVMAGQVRLEGQAALQPSQMVDANAQITVEARQRFVSRGGEKLEAAFQAFGLQAEGRLCADVGASTGGFTDCLLQHGAASVYAIDVGKGILDWKLRQDPRVVVMENVNARLLAQLAQPVSLVTIDTSFISLKILLPVVRGWLAPGPGNDVVALVKPQFEALRSETARGKGVIHDPQVHRRVLLDILGFAQAAGFGVGGLAPSPLLGPKGNREFLAWLQSPPRDAIDLVERVDRVI